MPLPLNITDLLTARTVESDRIEFKTGWNPDAIYRSICAFANDFDNIGGGYIIIGVAEENGCTKRPVVGLSKAEIAKIQKEMIGFNNLIRPVYASRLSIETVDQREIIVLWIPGGNDRPYEVPETITSNQKVFKYYIRRYASSIEAKGNDKEELIGLSRQVPFDDRPNRDAVIRDIDLLLIRDFLRLSGSRLAETAGTLPVSELLEHLNLVSGVAEQCLIRNVALLLFTEHPEKYFPYTHIDLVYFTHGPADRSFTEKKFTGPVQRQIGQVFEYLRSNVLVEKVIKQPGKAEAAHVWNYPFEAIEEAVVNSVYHRNYQEHEPITIRIEANRLIIYNVGGPDRSIRMEDLQKGRAIPKRYRNRRLGDFLKEIDLTEGRATGLAMIQQRLKENGSPESLIETDDDRSWFQITFSIHPAFANEHPETIIDNKRNIINSLKKSMQLRQENRHDQADAQADDQADDQALTVMAVILGHLADGSKSRDELLEYAGLKKHRDTIKRYVDPMEHIGWIIKTIPDKPTSPRQKYKLTEKGKDALGQ